MAPAPEPQQLSDAMIAFVVDGKFPDNISSLPPVSETDLQPTVEALGRTKTDLESEIHIINEETKEDVSTWARNAMKLQEDIIYSKTLANDIVRHSENPDVSGEAVRIAEEKSLFLNQEVQYSQQLHIILKKVRQSHQLLAQSETAKNEGRILDSLRLLEQTRTEIENVGVSNSCRILNLLNHRASQLKSSIHQAFHDVWTELIHFDVDLGSMSIRDRPSAGGMTLSEAAMALEIYKETDERMEQVWRNLNGVILSPRMRQDRKTHCGVQAVDNVLVLTDNGDASIEALLQDLGIVFTFLCRGLPSELWVPLAGLTMTEFIPDLIHQWLIPAVPSSLDEIPKFQKMLKSVESLCFRLEANGYNGLDPLQEWVTKSHLTWLARYREVALDAVRVRLSGGIGEPKQVEKVEKHMVTISEGKELSSTGAGAAADTNDWGDAWDAAWDDEANEVSAPADTVPKSVAEKTSKEDEGIDAWAWDDEGSTDKAHEVKKEDEINEPDAADAAADAWGWGDEDAAEDTEPAKPSSKRQRTEQDGEEKKELIFREKYYTSSMPESILELITRTLEDGATLTKKPEEYKSTASTAPGLFSVPTFALALFRAIAPSYYSLVEGGSMYLYNDAMFIAEQLTNLSAKWKERQDLTPRAHGMLRLENDIKTLQNFANRSYVAEMNLQRTVLHDLLGGSQGILQQDEPAAAIEGGITRIRQMAAVWNKILARSVWSQAVGSLVDSLASSIIAEVLEMSSIGQDEAYSIANLIVTATALDDLFPPSKSGAVKADADVPTTDQYAPNWPRLKYLSEILQSDLNGIRALWCEQKLSYYFTVDEVIDLIHASFEDNARTRQTIKDIQKTQYPVVDL